MKPSGLMHVKFFLAPCTQESTRREEGAQPGSSYFSGLPNATVVFSAQLARG